MGRLASLKAAAERDEYHDDGDVLDWITCYADEEQRFCFSLSYLERQTGLTRKSLVSGKRELHRVGIIDWTGDDASINCIQPRWDFRVIQTPTRPGYFKVGFGNAKG